MKIDITLSEQKVECCCSVAPALSEAICVPLSIALTEHKEKIEQYLDKLLNLSKPIMPLYSPTTKLSPKTPTTQTKTEPIKQTKPRPTTQTPPNGFFLFVPKGMDIEASVTAKGNVTDENLIIVEGTLSLYYDTSPDAVRCSTLNIIGKEHANITLIHSSEAKKITLKENILLEAHAKLTRIVAQLKGECGEVQSVTTLAGKYACMENRELFFSSKNQHFVIDTTINHKADYTCSRALTKGVVKDRASCVTKGLVKIGKNIKHASSDLTEHALLLSNEAHAETIPCMEIEAFDVQAKHSASVSRLDENQMFYAMSRGIPLKEAQKMILLGFLMPIIESIPENSCAINEQLTQKLEGQNA